MRIIYDQVKAGLPTDLGALLADVAHTRPVPVTTTSDDEETAAKDDGAQKLADEKAPAGTEAAPETGSASDAEASEAEEALEEPTQAS